MKHKLVIWIAVGLAALVLFVIAEILYIKYSATPVPVPNIPRASESYGTTGSSLQYVVLGDSTGVGQGGDYGRGIARSTARQLGQTHRVTLTNLAVSGARSKDVLDKQIPRAVTIEPDVVMIAISANDITHFTPTKQIVNNVRQILAALQSANPAVKIVLTGSPQMGSVPRFPQPIRYIAGVRTGQVNKALDNLLVDGRVLRAPIAEQTGPIFMKHPELFAPDKFHPDNDGYAIWIPVLVKTFDQLQLP